MSRRVFAPAVNGNQHTNQPAVIAGMHFHDLSLIFNVIWGCGDPG
jgi:hypothetical protein